MRLLTQVRGALVAVGRCMRVIDPPGFRRIERWNARDSRWKPTMLCRLRRGDIYRAYEPDGSHVLYDGEWVFVADEDRASIDREGGCDGRWVMWGVAYRGPELPS